MASISKSLDKAKNLRPVKDMLDELVAEKKRKDSFNKVLSMIDKTKQEYDQFVNPPQPEQFPEFSSLNKVKDLPLSDANVPDELPNSMMTNPLNKSGIPVRGFDRTVEKKQVTELDKQEFFNNKTMDFMKQFMADPELDPEAKQLGIGLLGMMKPQVRKKTISQEDPEKRTVETDELTGQRKVIDEGTGKKSETVEYERDKNGEIKVYTGPNGQKEYNKITRDKTGKVIKEDREQLQFEPKGTTVIVEDKFPAVNLANINKDLEKDRDDYDFYNRITKDKKRTPSEIKDAEEKKGIILGRIKANNKAKISQIHSDLRKQGDKSEGGFEGIINLLFQKLDGKPELIDSEVEKVFKGKSGDLIRWSKEILHNQIFN